MGPKVGLPGGLSNDVSGILRKHNLLAMQFHRQLGTLVQAQGFDKSLGKSDLTV